MEEPRKPSTVVKKAEPKKRNQELEQFVDFNSGFDHGFGGLAEYKDDGSTGKAQQAKRSNEEQKGKSTSAKQK